MFWRPESQDVSEMNLTVRGGGAGPVVRRVRVEARDTVAGSGWWRCWGGGGVVRGRVVVVQPGQR